MNINELWTTHNHLRCQKNLHQMILFIKSGGFWTKQSLEAYSNLQNLNRVSPLIQLSKFDDEKVFLHDGHHRVISTYLAGRDYLRPDEYQVTNWRYSDYLEVNDEIGWYTPFDPRSHTRTPDFANFKKLAKEKFLNNPIEAKQWIAENTHLFIEPRVFNYVVDLANTINLSQ
jgi:hypothetical protein